MNIQNVSYRPTDLKSDADDPRMRFIMFGYICLLQFIKLCIYYELFPAFTVHIGHRKMIMLQSGNKTTGQLHSHRSEKSRLDKHRTDYYCTEPR